ncbi:hypothetical protein SKAU_G00150950 [Synaphobranchus kaupii]|uniref:Sulfite oxidase n=1 Tax=Synaphobranchus kaupii TaxID=118154 RepID=A0A9Q1FGN1_SYNKA|nr:hypothetical protein SKAU_G00150950 [Synaphobranchus kaupii]
MYAVHNQEHVLEILAEYKVGELSPEDQRQEATTSSDPYSNDPPRHPALRVNSQKPFNGEPPSEILSENYITPTAFFFKRNHLPVPKVDPGTYRLQIEGLPNGPVSLSLEELKSRFPKHKVKGLNWGIAAISNATWAGARLRDVLLEGGYAPGGTTRHVQFEGLDKDVTGTTYGASIPVGKALSEEGDVLLAYEMNGEGAAGGPWLPRAGGGAGHGGGAERQVAGQDRAERGREHQPLAAERLQGLLPRHRLGHRRLQIGARHPGAAGAVGHHAASGRRRGRPQHGGGDGQGLRLERGRPGGGQGGRVAGWGPDVAGGPAAGVGRRRRGEERQANVVSPPSGAGRWAWKLWELTAPLPEDTRELEIVCKAVDSSYNMQPDTVAPIWNLRGVLSNAWHRVRVTVSED